ncbi:hypothetical protein QW71_36195 [Paenibacillus sp. IHB B 3415]|uniref:hypothetical protein n=1 Tax=Paenibacillus sp. IHB B 3415 TaxID=867080 RepID=UPI000573746F|nr:hypothetical protein [Paenibacillus sp. IHB B 3415]KHL91172.1 hypothetical protein QW71_36195 [Paenibacillus sp. IHB B 3415]
MYNLLLIKEECPRCGAIVNTEAEFKMGMMNLDTYKLGDKLTWAIGQARPPHQKRPYDGSSIGEGYVCCPNCEKDFWVLIRIEHDTIVDVKVDKTKTGYIK